MRRDCRVDALRGVCLLLMTWNHLPHPNFWCAFTYQGIGLLATGEAFVFLSGMVTAWVYGQRLIRDGFQNTQWSALKRVRLIYLTHLGLLAFYIAVSTAVGPPSTAIDGYPAWKAFLLGTVFYVRPSYIGDILAMYCFYIAAAPILLELIRRGRTWAVVLASAAFWTVGQIPGIFDRDFDLFAWQVLFVTGLIVAFPAVSGRRQVLSQSRWKTLLAGAVAIFFLIISHKRLFHLASLHLSPGTWEYLTYLTTDITRTNLHPARIVNIAALAYLAWAVPRKFEERYGHSLPYAALSFLGRHSLQVFAWSTCLAICGLFLNRYWADISGLDRAGVLFLVSASLYVPAFVHERMNARERSSRTLTVQPDTRDRGAIPQSRAVSM
jgi:hypothetical protein